MSLIVKGSDDCCDIRALMLVMVKCSDDCHDIRALIVVMVNCLVTVMIKCSD